LNGSEMGRSWGPRGRGITLLPLVAATYFMVAGGPYGLEELVSSVGYPGAIVALLITPIVWSLPTAFMVGELAGALPQEGGYYAWVRRAMGPFWGFQEAWLSLAASVFDMAIYPMLFTLYLARLWPAAGEGLAPLFLGVLMMAACAASNLGGSRNVGGSSVALTVVLLAPFAIMAVAAIGHRAPHASEAGAPVAPHHIVTGILVAMWNYMGWDNASTIAGEVDRPQRNYPLAMGIAVALVTLTYVVPVAVAASTGIDPSLWHVGAWVDIGSTLAGSWLGCAVVVGGMVCGLGMFDALLLAYSRLPAVLAEEGYLPAVLARRHSRSGAPWVSIVVCCVVYASCLGLGFQRLVELDVLLYGVSLALEFVALVLLRIREPLLARPFRIPGGLPAAIAIGLPPMAILAVALAKGAAEDGAARVLALGGVLLALGPVLYLARRSSRRAGPPALRVSG
jgi:amino acid transporter